MSRKRKFHKDRKVKKGVDWDKVQKILGVLKNAEDYLSMREIGKRSKVNENTVRYYLINHIGKHLDCLDFQEIIPGLRLKLVKIKKGYDAEGILRTLRTIKKID